MWGCSDGDKWGIPHGSVLGTLHRPVNICTPAMTLLWHIYVPAIACHVTSCVMHSLFIGRILFSGFTNIDSIKRIYFHDICKFCQLNKLCNSLSKFSNYIMHKYTTVAYLTLHYSVIQHIFNPYNLI